MDRGLPSSIAHLEERLGADWRAIRKAWTEAEAMKARVESAIKQIPSSDMSFVVFGSLARGEWTTGSDLDWTLLIDGVVDPKHQDAMHEARRVLKALEVSTDDKERKPGREETFGGIAFSHPIVHQIGGETDTNRNVTQRILLLSESTPIGRPDAYYRVLGAAIDRYVKDDRGLLYGSSDDRIPRFLLNDIVRYWRTVAVDFAYKQHSRGARGMALRNIKLRLSRKLVFSSGLLRCFLCSDRVIQDELATGVEEGSAAVTVCLFAWCTNTPLEVLADAIEHFTVPDDVAEELFSAYDKFIEFIDDERRRKELDELEGFEGRLFEEGRGIGRRFDEALKRMFFDGPQGSGTLASLTRKYGVF